MNGTATLFVDQYGQHFYARTLRELRQTVGGGRISKMYVDSKTRGTLHIGYVVGPHWLTAYQRVERPQ